MKIYLQLVLLFLILTIGLLYYYADYGILFYKNMYYVWDKTKDLLLVTAVALQMKKRLKSAWLILSAFFLVRLLWQLLEFINYKYANNPFFLYLLFLALGIATFIINIMVEKGNKKQDSKDGRN